MEAHRKLLSTYLASVLPLVEESSFLSSPGVRPAVRLFVLGMVDMVRSVYGLDHTQFIALTAAVLSDNRLVPRCAVEAYLSGVGAAARTHTVVEKVMREGADSIKSYVATRDAEAPADLLRIIVYAQANSEAVIAACGSD